MQIPKCEDCVYYDCKGCITCKVCEGLFTKINFKLKNDPVETFKKLVKTRYGLEVDEQNIEKWQNYLNQSPKELMAKYAKEKEQ